MAAELVGGALLSGFINVLFERLAPQDVILKFFGGKNIAELLEKLKINLRSANVVLNDAEMKQLTNPNVKKWVDDLTDVIYKADFLLDKIDAEASRRKREDESAASKASENDGWRMEELGELQLLEGRLRIFGLKNIVDVGDVLKANLKNKKLLSKLILEWDGESNDMDSQKEREILEALQPHTNLEKLVINGYRGTLFPDWVGHESYCNMVELELINCKNCCMLPPIEKLPSLRRLRIDGFDGFASIGNEFCCSSLEDLSLEGMDSLEWSFSNGQEGGSFSCLKQLKIFECKKLIVGLPDCCLPSLKYVSISGCDEMVAVSVCPSLEYIYVCHCPKLESLLEMGLASNLKDLQIAGCEKLWQNRMNWGLQRLSSLRRLYLFGIEDAVDLFPEEGLLPTTLTSLSIEFFENLKGLNGRAFQHLTSLKLLYISHCDELECLPEEGLPLSLSHLAINECPLLKQRCQRETGEDWPKIQHIPKITIDFRAI